MSTATGAAAADKRLSLLRVLGPGHVWALGVGIVLVGEFMGWNFAVGKGGALAGLIACWVAGLLYTCVAMIDSEVTSTVAAAGGQYAQAKHIVGPLMAFNVGLYLVIAYTMLEAGNAITVGYLIDTVAQHAGPSPACNQQALHRPDGHVPRLAQLPRRPGRRSPSTSSSPRSPSSPSSSCSSAVAARRVEHPARSQRHHSPALPYGWLGVLAALHFGLWYLSRHRGHHARPPRKCARRRARCRSAPWPASSRCSSPRR